MKKVQWNGTEDRSLGGTISYSSAVAVLCIITIIFTVFLWNYTDTVETNRWHTPTIYATCSYREGRNFTVTIEKIDPDAVRLNWTNFILLDDQARAVPGVQGAVWEINGVDLSNESVNITFNDRDRDWKVSAGDQFIIKHHDHGGEAMEGYALLLKFDKTGDKMNGGGTLLA